MRCARRSYRLSGPLEPVVCGLHLRNGWGLAFTMQPPQRPNTRGRVVILFVGKREPRRRASDAWTIPHDLFDVDNPPVGHRKPRFLREGAAPHARATRAPRMSNRIRRRKTDSIRACAGSVRMLECRHGF